MSWRRHLLVVSCLAAASAAWASVSSDRDVLGNDTHSLDFAGYGAAEVQTKSSSSSRIVLEFVLRDRRRSDGDDDEVRSYMLSSSMDLDPALVQLNPGETMSVRATVPYNKKWGEDYRARFNVQVRVPPGVRAQPQELNLVTVFTPQQFLSQRKGDGSTFDATSPLATATVDAAVCANATEDDCSAAAWTADFWVGDEGSGLSRVEVEAGDDFHGGEVHYRYHRFPVGSRSRHIVWAGADCCVGSVVLRAWDAYDNQLTAEVAAEAEANGAAATATWTPLLLLLLAASLLTKAML